MQKITTFVIIAVVNFMITLSPNAYAQEGIYTGLFNNTALQGYDAVAYFSQSSAMVGNKKWRYEWKGAEWRFASQENLDLFMASPEKYAPRYGGHCAWATSMGYIAPGSPQEWDIVDGKLYLNYTDSVQQKWRKNPTQHIERADVNWVNIIPQ